jgi:histone acetyltransferase (RNA polymerase elongator complex component)
MYSEKKEKPFIIPYFIPHLGCPHQCVFCNQSAITGKNSVPLSPEKLGTHINEFLKFKGDNRNTIQVAFYGGNFLGLKKADIYTLLDEVYKHIKAGKVDSIRFSTRPDTITKETMSFISGYPVSDVELGVQSMDDDVLALSRRGHTALDTHNAVSILKEHKYNIGLQMMVGLPGDNKDRVLDTGRKISALLPDFVRIYPTVVLENSPLASWYRKNIYEPLSLEECVYLVKKLYLLFTGNNIDVIRMGLHASEDLASDKTLLAGPYHPAFGHLVLSEIFLDRTKKKLSASLENLNMPIEKVAIKVNPASVSQLRGLKNKNIEILKRLFKIKKLNIVSTDDIKKNHIEISTI